MNESVFNGSLITEELTWGCSGIALAVKSSELGVCQNK